MTISCEECGKIKQMSDYILGEYVYKKVLKDGTTAYFCSWNCMRNAIRRDPLKYGGKITEVEIEF